MEKTTSECLRCRTLLSAVMDGEATFNEADFVRRHLGGCPDCREAQQAYHSLRAQLRLMSTPEPPAALRLAVMNRVNGKKAVYSRRPAAEFFPLLTVWQKGVFVTAALVLMFVAGFMVSMLLQPQPFEVEGQPIANTTEQKVVIAFNRPVDRNYILENAQTLFTVKDAQNNSLPIDFANIVVDGNTVELPIRRDISQLQENEPIQVFVDSHIKDEKGAEVTNPGSKVAVVGTQAPVAAAAPTKTKPGQVQAVVTTPVPATSTATASATAVPATTAPVPQVVDTPVSTTAPPTVATTAAPTAPTTVTPTVTVVSPTSTTAPATPTTIPVTATATVSPTVTTTVTPTVGTTPTVPVSPSVPATTTVAPTSTTIRPTTTAVATTAPSTVTRTPGTPGTATVPVTGTPVISVTGSPSVGPSTSPGTISPGGTVTGSPAVTVTTAAACSSDDLKGGFKELYPATQTRLGCPTAPQSQASFTYQVFKKGVMLYYQQTGRIYVFYSFGGWASYRATGPVSSLPTNTPVAPPTAPSGTPGTPGTAGPSSVTPNPGGCSFTPRGSFGTLWRNNQAVQSSLGCPTGQDNSTSAGIGQTFSRGLMLYNPLAGLPYMVVYNDGGFQAFPNQ